MRPLLRYIFFRDSLNTPKVMRLVSICLMFSLLKTWVFAQESIIDKTTIREEHSLTIIASAFDEKKQHTYLAGFIQVSTHAPLMGIVLKINAQNEMIGRYVNNSSLNSRYNAVEILTDGNILVVGYEVKSTEDLASLHDNTKVTKLLPSLDETIWDKSFGSESQNEIGVGAAELPNGHLLLVSNVSSKENHQKSTSIIKIDKNGVFEKENKIELPDGNHEASCISKVVNNTVVVAGQCRLTNASTEDAWVAKINTETYSTLWERTYGDDKGYDQAQAVILQSSGGVLLALNTEEKSFGSTDIKVVKVSSNGNTVWGYDKSYGGSGTDEVYSMRIAADNQVLIAGKYADDNSAEVKGWLFKLDTDKGDLLWQDYFPNQVIKSMEVSGYNILLANSLAKAEKNACNLLSYMDKSSNNVLPKPTIQWQSGNMVSSTASGNYKLELCLQTQTTDYVLEVRHYDRDNNLISFRGQVLTEDGQECAQTVNVTLPLREGPNKIQVQVRKASDRSILLCESDERTINFVPERVKVTHTSERQLVLVIGNSKYQHGTALKNPANDAEDVANKFRQIEGYEVMMYKDLTYQGFNQAIAEFNQQGEKGGVKNALVYYAGHALQDGQHNYLVPVDAHIENSNQIASQCYSMENLLQAIESANPKNKIIILDACRTNPFSESTGHKGLASVTAHINTLFVFATAPGRVAADGLGRNGLFTSFFLKYMDSPGLSIETMLKKVRGDVLQESNGLQVPWEHSSLVNDFKIVK